MLKIIKEKQSENLKWHLESPKNDTANFNGELRLCGWVITDQDFDSVVVIDENGNEKDLNFNVVRNDVIKYFNVSSDEYHSYGFNHEVIFHKSLLIYLKNTSKLKLIATIEYSLSTFVNDTTILIKNEAKPVMVATVNRAGKSRPKSRSKFKR